MLSKPIILFCRLFPLFFVLPAISVPVAYAKYNPNIVLVFMDNFGWGEQGFNGGGIIRGFYLSDSGSGALLKDYKAKAAGVCLALLWNTKVSNQYVSFIANWLHEVKAENRLEGEHLFLSFAFDW